MRNVLSHRRRLRRLRPRAGRARSRAAAPGPGWRETDARRARSGRSRRRRLEPRQPRGASSRSTPELGDADELLNDAAETAPEGVNPRTLALHGGAGEQIAAASEGIVDLLV